MNKNMIPIIAVLVILIIAISAYIVWKQTTSTNTKTTTTTGAPQPSTTTTTKSTPTTTTTLTSTKTTTGNKVTLRGSGATFPQPQIEAWINEFMKQYPNIVIEYRGIGSGAGQKEFFQGLTDFCGSDPPLSHEAWSNYKDKVLQLPIILGAVVVAYNVPEIPKDVHLNLTGEILALIYKGDIVYWDDERIKEINPAIADKLPHKEIIAVHRSDASGTTQIFTTFLHKAAPDIWGSDLVGKTIDWPVDKTGRGVGGKGNPGVTANIVNTEYSLGYVELAYALENNLNIAAIGNSEGNFVLPSTETIQAAAKHAVATGLIPDTPLGDFSKELDAIIYAPGKDSYPITAFSHIFVWRQYADKDKAEAIKEFIKWIYTEGSKHIVKGYIAVPEEIKKIGLKAVDIIEG